ncbi:MAG: AzlC family ABC transporter permease [Rhodospirillaceae bacterium]|nr:AzlC family ABC transporter permease [Rhodospirillaceae bacterium]
MAQSDPPSPATAASPYTFTFAGILRGMRRTLVVAVFITPFGIAYGVAATEQGMSATQAILMSAVVFAGAAQFATLDLWQAPVAFVSLALLVLAVNARMVIMGAALAAWLNRISLGRRLLTLGFLTDVNFADMLPVYRRGERDLGLLLGSGVVLWFPWVGGTALGALTGQSLGSPEVFGFDVVMISFFGAIVVSQTRRASIATVASAAVASVLFGQYVAGGWNILLAALVGGCVHLAGRHD